DLEAADEPRRDGRAGGGVAGGDVVARAGDLRPGDMPERERLGERDAAGADRGDGPRFEQVAPSPGVDVDGAADVVAGDRADLGGRAAGRGIRSEGAAAL